MSCLCRQDDCVFHRLGRIFLYCLLQSYAQKKLFFSNNQDKSISESYCFKERTEVSLMPAFRDFSSQILFTYTAFARRGLRGSHWKKFLPLNFRFALLHHLNTNKLPLWLPTPLLFNVLHLYFKNSEQNGKPSVLTRSFYFTLNCSEVNCWSEWWMFVQQKFKINVRFSLWWMSLPQNNVVNITLLHAFVCCCNYSQPKRIEMPTQQ